MQGVALAIALAVVVVLVAVLVTLGWRVARWTVRTRRILAFRSTVAGLTGRSESALAAVCERVDGARRGSLAGEEILADLAAATLAIATLAGESRRVRSPAATGVIVSRITEELDRAGRALEMVEHGCRLMEGGHGREHEPESQTAIKRGYLNLLHVRESLAEQAAAAAALPVTIPRFLSRRPSE